MGARAAVSTNTSSNNLPIPSLKQKKNSASTSDVKYKNKMYHKIMHNNDNLEARRFWDVNRVMTLGNGDLMVRMSLITFHVYIK
jgi:hypothetical protein